MYINNTFPPFLFVLFPSPSHHLQHAGSAPLQLFWTTMGHGAKTFLLTNDNIFLTRHKICIPIHRCIVLRQKKTF